MDIIILVGFIVENFHNIYLFSSRKEDLINCFKVLLHISTVVSFSTKLYTGIWKKHEFLSLLQTFQNTQVEKSKPIRKAYVLQTIALSLLFLSTYLMTDPLVFQRGIYSSAFSAVKDKFDISKSIYRNGSKIWTDSSFNGFTGTVFIYVIFFLEIKFYFTFWQIVVFNLVVVQFLRNNVKRFHKSLLQIAAKTPCRNFEVGT